MWNIPSGKPVGSVTQIGIWNLHAGGWTSHPTCSHLGHGVYQWGPPHLSLPRPHFHQMQNWRLHNIKLWTLMSLWLCYRKQRYLSCNGEICVHGYLKSCNGATSLVIARQCQFLSSLYTCTPQNIRDPINIPNTSTYSIIAKMLISINDINSSTTVHAVVPLGNQKQQNIMASIKSHLAHIKSMQSDVVSSCKRCIHGCKNNMS